MKRLCLLNKQSGGERVLFRPAPPLLQLHPELLPDGEAPSGGGDVRAGLQRRPRLLGHRRAVPRSLLSAQVPPEERARPRRDEERGGLAQDTRSRGLRGRQVCSIPKVPLGLARKTYNVHSSPGKSNYFICLPWRQFPLFQN